MTRRVLLADSDATLCDIYRQFFSNCGFQVETAVDGLECLNQLRNFMPHVLVLEWEILWGGGSGVLARLNEDLPLLPLHVVLITPDRTCPVADAPFSDRIVGCLSKPFHLSALRDHLGNTDVTSRLAHPA